MCFTMKPTWGVRFREVGSRGGWRFRQEFSEHDEAGSQEGRCSKNSFGVRVWTLS